MSNVQYKVIKIKHWRKTLGLELGQRVPRCNTKHMIHKRKKLINWNSSKLKTFPLPNRRLRE